MSNAEGLARAAAELALDLSGRMAPDAPGRKGTWEKDYGWVRPIPQVAPARLADDWSGDYPRAWRSVGEVRPYRSRYAVAKGYCQTLRREIAAALCPGTRIFVACVAIATFICLV
jgi:hypothetical protein